MNEECLRKEIQIRIMIKIEWYTEKLKNEITNIFEEICKQNAEFAKAYEKENEIMIE